ncbi:MAG: heat shock protein HtpX [Gammaproteobacteria bacterium]|jgi:heat shock protein HtpX|nr:heat shock protein HtpX [Gammaproteobacteria bacterium]
MKRILLFVATNLAIVVVLSVVAHLLGIDQYLDARGGSLGGLLIFAALFGFGGSLISLAISKWMAKKAMGVEVITQPRNATETWLLNAVGTHARNAGIGMPEVGIFESPDPNAFATGASRNNALVAVSTGLLQRMNEHEVDAVLGHEISHVANGDMVTLALIQGVVNTFVIFLSRIIGNIVDRNFFRSEDGRGPAYFISVIVSEIVLGILASLIVLWFSRWREFRADRGGAKLAGRGNMIAALEKLKATHEALPQQFAAFGIADGKVASGFARLRMSHPPLEERIAALRALPAEVR